ncbi:Tyrosine-protein phosphatase Lar [Geodia barretti]|uniref:Tyrosine-protein phosphatase Lar n=3 Tax=Geodia barretti TaxID=519541 RepID=A0AA35T3R3_GEOBA|nr:Tyrosine-protein phosphatase Lar [Geodia barretti]
MLEQNNETSINASWSPPPQSANITGYRVFWTQCTSSDCINQPVFTSSTVETLTGLMVGQCYSVYVVSVSDLPSNITTRNITLVTNPGSFNIDVASTSHGFSLMINLSNYVENGIYRIMSNVTWLRFLHCNNGLGSSNITDQTYDVNPMNLSITGLVPNSKYNVTVVVGNAVGRKTESVLNETRAAAPSAPPQDIVAVNQTLFTITISWKPVDCAHQNGNIRGYKIKYWERGSGNETKLDGNTTGTSYTLTGLQSSTTYVIQVAAKNDAGVGVFGNLNASTLPFEVSVASTTIGVTLGQVENDVLITWNRTSSQCVDNGKSFKTHHLSNSTMYMIPALEEYTEYNITVCINNSTCAFSIVTTNQDAPSAAPEKIKLKEKSSASITIMWSPVPCDHRNGNITGYVVMFRKLDNGISLKHRRAEEAQWST